MVKKKTDRWTMLVVISLLQLKNLLYLHEEEERNPLIILMIDLLIVWMIWISMIRTNSRINWIVVPGILTVKMI